MVRIVVDRAAINEIGDIVSPGPSREKQQKFKILDAPEMLAEDLARCSAGPGALGTAAIFLDLDHFKQLNTALGERVVDREVLPHVHRLIRDCVASFGFGYAEGGR